MHIPVNGYALTWSILDNTGSVYLHFVNNKEVRVPVDSAQELAALAEILRTSPMVAYDPEGQVLLAAVKPPGT